MQPIHRGARWLAAASLALVAAACADPVSPPNAVSRPLAEGAGTGRSIDVCKRTGIAGEQYLFTISGSGGTGWWLYWDQFTLEPSETPIANVSCKTVFMTGDPLSAPTTVTITETIALPDSMVAYDYPNGTVQKVTGQHAIVLSADYYHGYLVEVYNPVTPPGPGENGCTPGYWKQSQHFGNWVGYATGDSYNAIFGVSLFASNVSLLDALWMGGGGAARLGRHSTAALLNASNPMLNYGMTTAQVIALVRDAVATGKYNQASDTFEKLNERNCPLGRAE